MNSERRPNIIVKKIVTVNFTAKCGVQFGLLHGLPLGSGEETGGQDTTLVGVQVERTSVVSFYGFSEAQCEKIPNVGKSFAPKRQSSKTPNGCWNSREKLTICFGVSSADWNAKTTRTSNSSRAAYRQSLSYRSGFLGLREDFILPRSSRRVLRIRTWGWGTSTAEPRSYQAPRPHSSDYYPRPALNPSHTSGIFDLHS